MGMLDKLLGRDVDTFAKELAEMVAKRYPPTLDNAPERRISTNRISKVLEDALSKAAEYNRNARLGVYRKARLANTFKWQLKEMGYSDRFVEVATEGLVVYVSRAGGSKESESKS
jgi:hypothetical protein